MTIVESLTWANNKLKNQSDVGAPMLDAQLLLACVLNVSKNYLFTHFSQELTEQQFDRFEALTERRRHHEPIAYIIGWKEFYGRPFKVSNFVLIPRPDTEVLIDETKRLCEGAKDLLLVDIGTGSGAIAVTLAAETGLPVLAVDVSQEALVIAQQNANVHGVADHMTFLHGSVIEPIKPEMTASLNEVIIVANLPYLTSRQFASSEPDLRDYEPRLAFDGGVDGLDVYNQLFRKLQARRGDFPRKLTVLIEIDPSQNESAPRLIKQYFPHADIRVMDDLSHQPRIVISTL